jgi:hypothetical protein
VIRPVVVSASMGFGVIAFLVAFVLGTPLTLLTGIPLLGGLLNGVVTAMILTIGVLATRYFGTATLMWVIFGLCAAPSTTLGPPGIYKVAIGFIAGALWDIVYVALRRSTGGLFVGALVGAASIMVSLVYALKLGFGRDATAALAKYQKALLALIAINLVVTAIGVYLGRTVYLRRLENWRPFVNLRSDASKS